MQAAVSKTAVCLFRKVGNKEMIDYVICLCHRQFLLRATMQYLARRPLTGGLPITGFYELTRMDSPVVTVLFVWGPSAVSKGSY